MKFRPFNQTVSILAFKKEKEIYAATYAWFTQVGESEVVGLLGEQSVTTHNLKVGDYCGISVCSKEQKDVALYIGDTHSNEVDKLLDIRVSSAYDLRNKAMLELLYATGLRITELINLKITDVDIENCFVRVFGKGKKVK